jgi:hypothetical protein
MAYDILNELTLTDSILLVFVDIPADLTRCAEDAGAIETDQGGVDRPIVVHLGHLTIGI